MAHHAMQRLYKAVTRAGQRRDEIEMQSIDRLLSPLVPPRTHTTRGMATRSIARAGFRSILCPIDFSDQSRLALRYAAALARRSDGRLAILYVNDPLLIAAAGIALNDRTLATRNLAELRRFVEAAVSPQADRAGPIRRRGHNGKAGGRDHESGQAPTKRFDRDRHPWPDRRGQAVHRLDDAWRPSADVRPGPGDPRWRPRLISHPRARYLVAWPADHRGGGARPTCKA